MSVPSERLLSLAASIGYHFADPKLLDEALTHPSTLPSRGPRHGYGYERLEFLGDRVLGLVVAEMLFRHYGSENEGELARRHAALVCRDATARVALQMGLDRAVILSKGEEESGGRKNPTILGDVCEAVLGAVYADGGLDPARRIVESRWTPLMGEAVKPPKDGKTALQEWAQSLGKPLPCYRVVGVEGPSHEPRFMVEVLVEGIAAVTGSGTSKRAAEQAAAASMLGNLK